ncbi:MAG: hypothetical protein LBR32_06810 [Propionibacteriaceae bacterium]|nr:hypothetical protein [Propionibacteriaceae bacterium]
MGLLVLCVTVLAGCSPLSAGFVAVEDGRYVLEIPEACGMRIFHVGVAYLEGSGSEGDFWAADAEPGMAANRVVLFEPNDGYVATGDGASVDVGRSVVMKWDEAADGGPGFVSGVLGDLAPGRVLWREDMLSADDYGRQVLGRLADFRCVGVT